jgi:hypothetical protein
MITTSPRSHKYEANNDLHHPHKDIAVRHQHFHPIHIVTSLVVNLLQDQQQSPVGPNIVRQDIQWMKGTQPIL